LNTITLWEIVQANAGHIETLNREMGVVQTYVTMLLRMAYAQFFLLFTLLALGWRNIYWTKRNGGKK
jgi:hypothetical protein